MGIASEGVAARPAPCWVKYDHPVKVLHGQCYHNDVFKSGQRTRVANAVGRARELVEVILLARGRTK